MHRDYDLDFANAMVPLDNEDIEFGKRFGLIATDRPQRLAHLFPSEKLPEEWSSAHEKWRLVALIWAIENCQGDTRSLFDEVDTIWANFNEPKDMKHLVSFMSTDDPLASKESLMTKILNFVTDKKSTYTAG